MYWTLYCISHVSCFWDLKIMSDKKYGLLAVWFLPSTKYIYRENHLHPLAFFSLSFCVSETLTSTFLLTQTKPVVGLLNNGIFEQNSKRNFANFPEAFSLLWRKGCEPLSLKQPHTENGAPAWIMLLSPPHYNSLGILYVLVHSHCCRILVPLRHKDLTQDLLLNL